MQIANSNQNRPTDGEDFAPPIVDLANGADVWQVFGKAAKNNEAEFFATNSALTFGILADIYQAPDQKSNWNFVTRDGFQQQQPTPAGEQQARVEGASEFAPPESPVEAQPVRG